MSKKLNGIGLIAAGVLGASLVSGVMNYCQRETPSDKMIRIVRKVTRDMRLTEKIEYCGTLESNSPYDQCFREMLNSGNLTEATLKGCDKFERNSPYDNCMDQISEDLKIAEKTAKNKETK